ncbi:MAG: hypothetical protein NTV54_15095 [Ignavibacteriales bacterium]|nr:hypothetical protein [Ignavibacteriales bacterium]
MNHLTHSEMLSFLDGMPNMEAAAEHLSTCSHCAREFEFHRMIARSIHSGGLQSPSKEFSARTMARIMTTRPSIRHQLLDNAGSVFAMMLVLGFVGAVLFGGNPPTVHRAAGVTAQYLQEFSQALVRTTHYLGTWTADVFRQSGIRTLAIASLVLLLLSLTDKAVSRKILKPGASRRYI